MGLLENDGFLMELTRLFQKSKEKGVGSSAPGLPQGGPPIRITMKRYDGRTKPIPKARTGKKYKKKGKKGKGKAMALRLCSPYVVRLLVPARVAYPTVSPALPLLVQQTRGAARRGTREKRKRAHKKKEVEKQKWIPKAEIAAQIERLREKPSQRFQCHGVWPPSDDIYVSTFYRPYSYTLKEALEMLRENWHPTTGDRPNYMVTVNLELDMRLPKKSAGAMQRYMSTIRSLVDLPHMIPSGEDSRSVLAFVKSEEGRQEALAAGADLVGTMNTIKEISSGKLDFHNFDYIVAHPDILPDMVAVRGLLRKKFPQKKDGSLTADIGAGVRKFKYGLSIESKEEESEPSYGVIESPIGPTSFVSPCRIAFCGGSSGNRMKGSAVIVMLFSSVAAAVREDPYDKNSETKVHLLGYYETTTTATPHSSQPPAKAAKRWNLGYLYSKWLLRPKEEQTPFSLERLLEKQYGDFWRGLDRRFILQTLQAREEELEDLSMVVQTLEKEVSALQKQLFSEQQQRLKEEEHCDQVVKDLTLTDEELDKNLRALVDTVMDFKPPESELIFLRHILLLSRPLKEVFRVTPSAYTSEKEDAFDEYVRLRAEEREAQATRQREVFALDNKKLKKKDFWDNYIFKLYYQNVSRKFKW
ncbi:unnamed protein product [Cyprideis torosa]|uniref:Uncharacterized protein n=1 Tax=Cyprideis torosa TaxID=163714 RepID=A0A7R8W3B0_9CRUS|nr:unnamed protein product [Cyprideis torosa]CAG0880648.1 unnamed protein product [Cyprideis torosa]